MSNRASVSNYDDSPNLKTSGSQPPVFLLCESCHWCATYLDKARLPLDNQCPYCSSDMLSSFPILTTEAFTFDYNETRGVELEFRRRNK